MSVVSIQPKDFILALFIRDDGERFLLGDKGYDFTDSQLHFSANTIENDEVEKQGADGTMLAGQVRRASVQTFDGYVGDATTPKEEIEQMRRAFIAFFLKGHHYRVVYVDCARNAWQRKGGYLVDAPEVKELFQVHPEYHVGLNFEDVNYYSYDENAEGDEITANLVQVAISSAVEGGLVWDEDGAVSDDATAEYITETATASGKSISVSDAVEAPLKSLEIQGNTTQQTYTGKNLTRYPYSAGGYGNGITFTNNGDGSVTLNGQNSGSGNSSFYLIAGPGHTSETLTLPAGTYYFANPGADGIMFSAYDGTRYYDMTAGNNYAMTLSAQTTLQNIYIQVARGTTTTYNNTKVWPMLSTQAGQTATDFEPYVGGVPAPNPDYPQAVQTVTGENILTISDGTNTQSYEVNLGKNLFDVSAPNGLYRATTVISGNSVKVTASANGTGYCAIIIQNSRALLGKTCTISFDAVSSSSSDAGQFRVYSSITTNPSLAFGSYLIDKSDVTSGKSYQVTFPSNFAAGADCFAVFLYPGNKGNSTVINDWAEYGNVQLELGSQATSYAAYFTPIELCKIGTYQDYIYKSSGKWYVHKETGKETLNSTSHSGWQLTTSADGYIRGDTVGEIGFPSNVGYCDKLVTRTGAHGSYEYIWFQPTTIGKIYIQILASRVTALTLAAFNAWLDSATPTVYYSLTTPTDTEITNQALVAQLEAIRNGGTHVGTNNIALIPSGNEQGSLEITYYTKYIVNITAGGYEWEQGGSGGPTIVMNESIDNVYPIWTITGPITNPVLENTTTGEQIEYVGTIGEGQKLIIDMGEQTALLDGLNVLSNVAGEFISLAPGANTLLYSVSNGDTASEIGWSEIVG